LVRLFNNPETIVTHMVLGEHLAGSDITILRLHKQGEVLELSTERKIGAHRESL
jgi:hypothetical protein